MKTERLEDHSRLHKIAFAASSVSRSNVEISTGRHLHWHGQKPPLTHRARLGLFSTALDSSLPANQRPVPSAVPELRFYYHLHCFVVRRCEVRTTCPHPRVFVDLVVVLSVKPDCATPTASRAIRTIDSIVCYQSCTCQAAVTDYSSMRRNGH